MSTGFSPFDPSAGKTYPAVNPSQVARVEIFPPLGFARVGDSGALPDGSPDPDTEIEYYYSPEVPGITDAPFGDFRDPQKRVRRQVSVGSLVDAGRGRS